MTNLATTLIRPDDENWFVDGGTFWVPAQAAIGKDCCMFIAAIENRQYDYFDPGNPYCRLYKYNAGIWTCAELGAQIVSIMLYKESGWAKNGLALLGVDGNMWFLGPQGYHTKIDVADADNLGHLRLLNGLIYVTGHNGQIYRRDADGWHHDDTGLLNAAPSIPRPRRSDHGRGFSESDLILTPDEADFYCCGSMYLARPGLFWRPRGRDWIWLGLDPNETKLDFVNLTGMYAASQDDIWISTRQGFLLNGSGRSGFKVATATQVDESGASIEFSNIVRYQDHLFVGGTTVCRLLGDGTLEPQTGRPQPLMGLPQFVRSSIEGPLSVADGVLWAVGEGVLSRFDGSTWEQFVMPSIYRNNRR